MPRQPRVNLATLSELAGVSRTTVHDALHGKGRVNPETRARVQQLAAELGYRPNRLASALRTQRSHVLGVIVSGLYNALFERMLSRIEAIAQAQQYDLFFTCSYASPEKERRLIDLLLGSAVDGIIMFPSAIDENLAWYMQALQGTHTVMVEPSTTALPFDTVGTDNEMGGYLAGQELLRAGCDRLAFILPLSITRPYWWVADRLRGLQRAAREAGVAPVAVLAPAESSDACCAHYGARRLSASLAEGHRPNGLFGANDEAAIQALAEYRARDLDEVAVIGYDDTLACTMHTPPLSSLRQPMERIGETAIRLLLNRLHDEHADEASEQLSFPPTLIARQSTLRRAPNAVLEG